MKHLAILTVMALALSNPVLAAGESQQHKHKYPAETSSVEVIPLKLADGSQLFLNANGSMRMVDKSGKPLSMIEGVEMTLEDGSIILMHNKKIFRHIHKRRPWESAAQTPRSQPKPTSGL